jgi:anti-sigma-K factor RskA
MTCQEREFELYVFGTVEPGERAEIDAHLERSCETCTTGVAKARRLSRGLALTVPHEDPPEHLRSDILRAIAQSTPREMPFWHSVLWRLSFPVSVIAALALLVICIGFFTEVRSLNREAETLRISARQQRDIEQKLLQRLAVLQDAIRQIPTAGTRQAAFVPKQPKQPSGHVYIHSRGLLLVAAGMPKPPQGRTYELWLFAKGQPAPIPAGVFDPDNQGHAMHVLQERIAVATIKQIAITDEPPGGVSAPTGKVLLSAAVK